MKTLYASFFFLYGMLAVSCAMAQQKVTLYQDENDSIPKEVFYISQTDSATLSGPYEAYFTDGTLKVKGSYEKNIPHGEWKYYYENGNLKMRGPLQNGVNAGLWEYFYENGNLQMQGQIYDNLRNGNWKFFFENGELKSKGSFQENQRTGIWNYFYEDGTLKAQEFFKCDTSQYKEFYTSGVVKLEGTNVNGKNEGLWYFYHENGNLKAAGLYENGIRAGPWKFYHENGNLASEGNMQNDEANGEWTYYHENGNISAKGEEKAGVKEGFWRLYHKNGEQKGQAVFTRGEGLYKELYENGNTKIVGKISNGVNQGKWQYFYKDGTLEGECIFVNGSGKYVGYYPDGTVKMKGKIEHGVRTGIWELYHQDGSLAGYYRNVYENDQPVFIVASDTAGVHKNQTTTGAGMNPDYLYRKKNSRYFKRRINEYRGIIISVNPAELIFHRISASVEYYLQERLGYEIEAGVQRDPLLTKDLDIAPNQVFQRGYFAALKQKFYHPDTKVGIIYLGHRLGYRFLDHFVNIEPLPGQNDFEQITTVSLGKEQNIEYSLLVGTRLMRNADVNGRKISKISRYSGFTLDIFGGIGLGYRFFTSMTPEGSVYEEMLNEIPHNKISFPYHVGLSIGYIF